MNEPDMIICSHVGFILSIQLLIMRLGSIIIIIPFHSVIMNVLIIIWRILSPFPVILMPDERIPVNFRQSNALFQCTCLLTFTTLSMFSPPSRDL